MDWSKTKTIFIAVFLVLDLFLAAMFFNKYGTSQFKVMEETPIEVKLQQDNVTYEKLPAETGKRSVISAKPKRFTEEDLAALTKQQTIISEDGLTVTSVLDKPFKTNGAARDNLNAFVSTYVWSGEEYAYWDQSIGDGKPNTVTYYQKIQDEKLFENTYGMLTLQLDAESNVTGYTQTKLTIDDGKDQREVAILPALDALDALYRNGIIQPDSEISDVELGYSTPATTLLAESQAVQVLSPTWYFQLQNGGQVEEVYVNAFEGDIYQTNKTS